MRSSAMLVLLGTAAVLLLLASFTTAAAEDSLGGGVCSPVQPFTDAWLQQCSSSDTAHTIIVLPVPLLHHTVDLSATEVENYLQQQFVRSQLPHSSDAHTDNTSSIPLTSTQQQHYTPQWTLVFLYSSICRLSARIAPVVEVIAALYGNRQTMLQHQLQVASLQYNTSYWQHPHLSVVRIDGSQYWRWASRHKASLFPTMLLFRNNELEHRLTPTTVHHWDPLYPFTALPAIVKAVQQHTGLEPSISEDVTQTLLQLYAASNSDASDGELVVHLQQQLVQQLGLERLVPPQLTLADSARNRSTSLRTAAVEGTAVSREHQYWLEWIEAALQHRYNTLDTPLWISCTVISVMIVNLCRSKPLLFV